MAGAILSVAAQAQEAVKSGPWSARSTWSRGAVPKAGSKVTINDKVNVVLDVSPPALNGLTVMGKGMPAETKDECDADRGEDGADFHGSLLLILERWPAGRSE